MEEKRRLSPYESPQITITCFGAGDCISTSSDISFNGDENWNGNIPSAGWT